jgi:phage terminase small subunit
MPILRSIKAERFASAIAEGMTSEQAHKAAGYSGIKAKQLGEQLRCKVEVRARIKELTARISKSAVAQAAKKLSLTKEMIMAELWDNAQQGAKVKGGSSVRYRALELLGKELGMFQDNEPKPLKLEDLSTEDLKKLLEQEEAAAKGTVQ